MKSNYQHIFTPLTVKNMTIKNRIVMMPMGTNYGEQNGEMSFLHINYYKERAKGGTGLIIVENASVDSPQGSNGTTQLSLLTTTTICLRLLQILLSHLYQDFSVPQYSLLLQTHLLTSYFFHRVLPGILFRHRFRSEHP